MMEAFREKSDKDQIAFSLKFVYIRLETISDSGIVKYCI